MSLEMQLGYEPTGVPGKMPNLGETLADSNLSRFVTPSTEHVSESEECFI